MFQIRGRDLEKLHYKFLPPYLAIFLNEPPYMTLVQSPYLDIFPDFRYCIYN